MRDTDLAWAAGIIDGEGCIDISLRQGRYAQLDVSVVNTDPRLLLRLRELFRGSVHHRPHQTSRPRHRMTWRWTIVSRQAETFLRQVRPYLVIKQEQADIALAMRKTMRIREGHGRTNYPLSPAEQVAQMWFRRQMRDLKHCEGAAQPIEVPTCGPSAQVELGL